MAGRARGSADAYGWRGPCKAVEGACRPRWQECSVRWGLPGRSPQQWQPTYERQPSVVRGGQAQQAAVVGAGGEARHPGAPTRAAHVPHRQLRALGDRHQGAALGAGCQRGGQQLHRRGAVHGVQRANWDAAVKEGDVARKGAGHGSLRRRARRHCHARPTRLSAPAGKGGLWYGAAGRARALHAGQTPSSPPAACRLQLPH